MYRKLRFGYSGDIKALWKYKILAITQSGSVQVLTAVPRIGHLESTWKEEEMPECECGCGERTLGGSFLPGHDQKLRTSLEARVGGILHLRDLVELSESYVNGKLSLQDFGRMMSNIFRAEKS